LDEKFGGINKLCHYDLVRHLAGKHALVVGGTRGIGMGTAKSLASCGVNVTIVGRNSTAGNQVLNEMTVNTPSPLDCRFIQGDLSTVAGAFDVIEKIKQTGLKYDYLVITVFTFPDWTNMFTEEGLEKSIAIGILGRYIIFDHCHEFLVSQARILNVAYCGTVPSQTQIDREVLTPNKKPKSLMHAGSNVMLMTDLIMLEFMNRWKKNQYTLIGTAPAWITTELHQGQGFILDKIIFPVLDKVASVPLTTISLDYTNLLYSPSITNKLTFFDPDLNPRLPPDPLIKIYNSGESKWLCNFLDEWIYLRKPKTTSP